MLQSEGEPAILELLTELGRQLPHVKIQTAPRYSHQSEGVVNKHTNNQSLHLERKSKETKNKSTKQSGLEETRQRASTSQ
eukprot:546946-Amphidinium_carterae.1